MPEPKWKNVGFLIFEGFEVLDDYGPLEMIGMLKTLGHVEQILMIAQTQGPIKSAQGPATIADVDFFNCPPLDVLFVPGGMGTRKEIFNKQLLQFITSRYDSELQHLVSICTGAALLKAASLLDGKKATTNKRAFDWVTSLQTTAANVDDDGGSRNSNTTSTTETQWERKARFVRDGNITSSAGVSAGMDATLYLIDEVFGEGVAREVAAYAEYSGDYTNPDNDPFG